MRNIKLFGDVVSVLSAMSLVFCAWNAIGRSKFWSELQTHLQTWCQYVSISVCPSLAAPSTVSTHYCLCAVGACQLVLAASMLCDSRSNQHLHQIMHKWRHKSTCCGHSHHGHAHTLLAASASAAINWCWLERLVLAVVNNLN